MTPITAPTEVAPSAPPTVVGAHRRMVALDIDGTLTKERSRDVPQQTRDAVADARRDGHEIVLASGRSLVGVLPVARALRLEGPVVASNGAVTAHLLRDRPGFVLDKEHVHRLDAAPVIIAALNARLPQQLQYAAEVPGRGFLVSSLFPDGLLNGDQKVLPLAEIERRATPRMVLRGPGVHDLIAPLHAVGLTATPAAPDWVDVTPAGVSKASALEVLRERLGIAQQYTVAVGDGVNDLEMLAWAARGVAMGHAPARVRLAAGEVTGTLEEAGVVDVLRSLAPPDRGLARQIRSAVEQWCADQPTQGAQDGPQAASLVLRARRRDSGRYLDACELLEEDGRLIAGLPAGDGTTHRDIVLAVVAAGFRPRLTQDEPPRAFWRFDANGPHSLLSIHGR